MQEEIKKSIGIIGKIIMYKRFSNLSLDRGVVIGGTSSGMAILGVYIWDGEKNQTDFLRLYNMKNKIVTHIAILEIESVGI